MVYSHYPRTCVALMEHGLNPAVIPVDGLYTSGYETFSPVDRTTRTMHAWPSDEAMRDVLDAYAAESREAQ